MIIKMIDSVMKSLPKSHHQAPVVWQLSPTNFEGKHLSKLIIHRTETPLECRITLLMILEDGAGIPESQLCRSDWHAREQPLCPQSCVHEWCQPRGPLPLGAWVSWERPSWNSFGSGHSWLHIWMLGLRLWRPWDGGNLVSARCGVTGWETESSSWPLWGGPTGGWACPRGMLCAGGVGCALEEYLVGALKDV